MSANLLSVSGLTRHFPVNRGLFNRTVAHVRAVDGIRRARFLPFVTT